MMARIRARSGCRRPQGRELALAYHGAYEFNTPLSELPGGPEWQAVVERTAPDERHLAVHAQHCVGLNEADQAAWDAGGHATARAGDDQRDRRPGRRPALRSRGGGRDRIGVPTLRSGHSPRAGGVYGNRADSRRGVRERT